jgi:hypothetical protein
VSGTHTYPDPGVYTVTTQVFAAGGAGAGVVGTSSATVAAGPLTFAGHPVGMALGVGYSGLVATLTGAGATTEPEDYEATITWGDGSTTPGVLTPAGVGKFRITGGHTYLATGSFPITISLSGAATATASTTATVAAEMIMAAGLAIQAVQGQPFSGAVATFACTDPDRSAGDFTALVTWDDGSTSDGQISPSESGGFTVFADHTFAVDGTRPVTVAVADSSEQTDTATSAATVVSGLAASAWTIMATAGAAFAGLVGGITDPDVGAAPGDYAATIDWGDNTTTAGTVSVGAEGFVVSGTHTYVVPGTYIVGLSITDDEDHTVTAEGSATVAAAAGVAGQPVDLVVSLAGPSGTTNQDTATIDWGDGSTTAGSIVVVSGMPIDILGSHAYRAAGFYPVAVTHTGPWGSTTYLFSYAIADAPLVAAGVAVQATEGEQLGGVVATFTSDNPLATADTFTAVVDWGDGAASLGTVVSDGQGGFVVFGDTRYDVVGAFAVSVWVYSTGGSSASATATATVTAAAPSLTPLLVEATAGESFTGELAWFVDPDTTFGPEDYEATIDWGGTSTSGSVEADGEGGFVVVGSHVFLAAGQFTVEVTLTRADGVTSTRTVPAVVGERGVVGTGSTLTATVESPFAGVVGTFVESNPPAGAGSFSALIAWGDGGTSEGAVTGSAGSYTVSGEHAYTVAGVYGVEITVSDVAGVHTTILTTAAVSDPLAVTILPLEVAAMNSASIRRVVYLRPLNISVPSLTRRLPTPRFIQRKMALRLGGSAVLMRSGTLFTGIISSSVLFMLGRLTSTRSGRE